MDFAIPAEQKIKLKESEKRDKYLDPAREQKKMWNVKVTVIPIVIGVFGIIFTLPLRSGRIWHKVNF